MPQNRPQYTFGQLVSLVEDLKSSVNSLRSDFDKIKESNDRLERRLTKVENNSNNNEENQDQSRHKELKREEIKREIMDYKEDISWDQIEPADIQRDLMSLETESEAPHVIRSKPKQESHLEMKESRKRMNITNVDVESNKSEKLPKIKYEVKGESKPDSAESKDGTQRKGRRKEKEEVRLRRRSEKSMKQDDGGQDEGGGDTGGCWCGSSHTDDHMIGCDGPCARWFHYDCVGISDSFSSRAGWYCETCFLQLSGGRVEVN